MKPNRSLNKQLHHHLVGQCGAWLVESMARTEELQTGRLGHPGERGYMFAEYPPNAREQCEIPGSMGSLTSIGTLRHTHTHKHIQGYISPLQLLLISYMVY